MPFDPRSTLTKVQSLLAADGFFAGGVVVGDLFAAPSDTTAAIFMRELAPTRTTLNATIDVCSVTVRVYAKAGMTTADAQSAELALAQAVFVIESALAGAFTLGGTVRAIDWAGEEAGFKISAKWGHLVIGGTILRVVDVIIPCIVDDSAIFAP